MTTLYRLSFLLFMGREVHGTRYSNRCINEFFCTKLTNPHYVDGLIIDFKARNAQSQASVIMWTNVIGIAVLTVYWCEAQRSLLWRENPVYCYSFFEILKSLCPQSSLCIFGLFYCHLFYTGLLPISSQETQCGSAGIN